VNISNTPVAPVLKEAEATEPAETPTPAELVALRG
jgi:hypothetical protein